ncbi:hypothetical protein [Klebsiella pneumoniae]|uniref:hypothetical protein n=1 Tax=Klebsiella pneumoniae TaxID=573 RepID=UPI0021098CD9|nr:hypothetical protein [Klebsiella pneumoniae]
MQIHSAHYKSAQQMPEGEVLSKLDNGEYDAIILAAAERSASMVSKPAPDRWR